MVVVLKTQDYSLSPGQIVTFTIPDWANAAHNVQVFVEWLNSTEPRRFKVPMIYVTEQVIAVSGGVAVNFERQKHVIVFAGISFIPLKPAGNIGAAVIYCRDNRQTIPVDVRARLINFSI